MRIIKKRNLKLERQTNKIQREAIKDRLKYVIGVENIDVSDLDIITVSYDLLETNLKSLIEILREISYPVKERGFEKLRLNFIHYTEKNEHDNAMASESAGCSTCSSLGSCNLDHRHEVK